MELMPGAEKQFLQIFDKVKYDIRAQQGCLGLEVLSSQTAETTSLWTISFWQTADDLETYRASALFTKTWSEVKPLFASKAKAWTLTPIEHLS